MVEADYGNGWPHRDHLGVIICVVHIRTIMPYDYNDHWIDNRNDIHRTLLIPDQIIMVLRDSNVSSVRTKLWNGDDND